MKKIYSIIAVLFCCLFAAHAQTVTFDSEDYKAVGVYDSWEASPFRTGVLTGNAAVVDNPFKDEVNGTDKVLGVQRSRFASNMYGARIDLKETFELTPTPQYVHVMIHKPGNSRVMLMGLGKRQDRAGQSPETEQFWERSNVMYEVQADEWFDAVFSIKGNGGIDIYSLVVVVDAVSPHALTEDFVAYIDEIEVNNSNKSRTVTMGDYPICFLKTQAYTRTDRKVNGVALESPSAGKQTVTLSNNLCYNEVFTPTINVKAGETVTPSVTYKGTWMNSYIYVDWGKDGAFSFDVDENGARLDGSDLVSWSRLNSKDVYGNAQSNNNYIIPADFTIPEGTAKGIYRMRYKVDWNYADPAGNDGSINNYIIDNGGGIVDLRLNVHEDNVTIARSGGLNGDIVHADGTEFDTETVPFGQEYKIYMQPAPGFSIDSLVVRHGYNLEGEAIVKSTPQWVEDVVRADDFAEDGSFTLPAEWIDGDVILLPEFIETASVKPTVHFTYDLQWQGETKATQEAQAKAGDPFPAIDTTVLPGFTTANAPEGEVTEDLEGKSVAVEIVTDGLPFECYTSLDDIKTWYNVSLKQKYIYDQGENDHIDLTCDEAPEDDNTFIWGFVGSPFDGFSLFNYDTHNVLSTTLDNISSNTGGNTWPIARALDTMPENCYYVWDVTSSTYYADGFYLAVRGQGNGMYRMNSRDEKLAFWTGGADAGSTFCVLEAEPAGNGVDSIQAADGSKAIYDLSGRRQAAEPKRGLYIVEGKKKLVK